jgi:hypothetical protein
VPEKMMSGLKFIFMHFSIEMQNSTEFGDEGILEAMEIILQSFTQSKKLPNLVKQMQGNDFMLEYLLSTMLFLAQNRERASLIRLSLKIQSQLFIHIEPKPSINCYF